MWGVEIHVSPMERVSPAIRKAWPIGTGARQTKNGTYTRYLFLLVAIDYELIF